MSDSIVLPNYDTIEAALSALNALGTAADSHGLLSAFVVAGINVEESVWISSITANVVDEEDMISRDAKDALLKLFRITQNALESDAYEFALLLRDDETTFELRIETLAQWCQGFVSGLRLAGISKETLPEGAARESLTDLIDISCLEYNDEQLGDESSETAFFELSEFARLAVIMIRDTIRAQRQGKTSTENRTVH